MSEIASYQPLVDAFAVCGLASGEPLSTITGEAGYQGTDARYRPSVTDSLASPRTQHGPVERGAKLPTHFAMVSQGAHTHGLLRVLPVCLQSYELVRVLQCKCLTSAFPDWTDGASLQDGPMQYSTAAGMLTPTPLTLGCISINF
eukprot:1157469-Pelagomonas_calceolata.AAC.4